MSFEAYSVAVKLSLINNVSSGLLLISKNMKTVHDDAEKLNQKLKSIGKNMAIGGALFGGGIALAGILKGPYEEAKKLAQAKADFATLNLSAAETEKVYAAASLNAHKNLGMSITDNIKMVQDLHTAMGNLPHALEYLPQFSQFAIAAKIRNGGKDVDGLILNASKALEHRGDKVMMHPKEFDSELDMLSKVYFATRGIVDPRAYYMASKTGGMAYSLLDKNFLYGKFAGYMSTQSGDSAGTSLMTAFSSLVGGHMDNKAKGFLARLGMLQVGVSPEQVRLTKEAVDRLHLPAKDAKKLMGAMMPVTGGLSDKYLELYAKDPDKFIGQYMAPAIRRVFGQNLSNEQVSEIITKYFNRGTSKFLGSLVLSEEKFAKDSNIIKKSMGFHDAYSNYIKSPEGAEIAAGEAWKNLLALVGSVYLPTITKGLMGFATWLDRVGQYVEHNKTQVKFFVAALAGLSAFLIAGGLILMIHAATSAFILLGGALIGLPARLLAARIATIAMSTSVIGAATSFGLLQKAASAFMVFAAAYAGYQAGTWLNNHVVNPGVQKLTGDKNATLGTWIYDKFHPNDGKNAVAPVATRHSQPIQVHTSIEMDGKKIASAVTVHQTNAASKLPASTGVNPYLGMPFPSSF
ncbi:hypothetical protein E0H78_07310 [Acinetobacter sp. ANC 4641]|uniref:hypothetical protein n=1 Tax=Acinetobacter sp. ANC 4641 TaxID=2529847 RepID=UPI00103DC3F0|nr:hypothetical protein [Acinetobacter sp. ANC 4641]TCB11433.1 hypothetical protein E0H78_07310 [Acinetobacter sp. ANC 4641]